MTQEVMTFNFSNIVADNMIPDVYQGTKNNSKSTIVLFLRMAYSVGMVDSINVSFFNDKWCWTVCQKCSHSCMN